MNEIKPPDSQEGVGKIIRMGLQIVALVVLIGWSFIIILPFIYIILWGIIIAVATFPFYQLLLEKVKGRLWLATTITMVLFLLIYLVPALILTNSLADGIWQIKKVYDTGTLVIPPPDERVNSWPAIGKPLIEIWTLASQNFEKVMQKFDSEIRTILGWLLTSLAGIGLAILKLLIATILASILLRYYKSGEETVKKIFNRLAGENDFQLIEVSKVTIRNVVKGILGVATIQALLAGLGMVVVGIPGAGLWTLFCLISAILQLGVSPVLVPAVIFVFYHNSPISAWLFLIWSVLVFLSENILKPWLMGKGSVVPTIVVFLGSVGGFLSNGFIGLFLGPVILALGFKFYQMWVEDSYK